MIFTGLTITFLKEFGVGLWLTFPLLLTLAAAITVLGQVVEGKKAGPASIASIGRLSQRPPSGTATFGQRKNHRGSLPS